MHKNKKADLAVTLLVFMAVALSIAALVIFNTSSGKLGDKIVDARFLDEIYLTEEKLDFYVNEIMDKSVEKTLEKTNRESENFVEEFVSNFKEELVKYKDEKGNYILFELADIEKQISEYKERNNIKVESSKIIVKFTIKVGAGFKENKLNAIHTYKKTFEKEISTYATNNFS